MEVFFCDTQWYQNRGYITLGHQSDDNFFFSGLIKQGMDTRDDSLWCADMLKSITSQPAFEVHASYQSYQQN